MASSMRLSTRRYQKILNRHQEMLLPSRVEDYVSENNPVRAIDAYVDTLDLEALGFQHAANKTMMRQPAYDPAALLKLYLYGYIHHIRKDNAKALKVTNRDFILMCKELDILPMHVC